MKRILIPLFALAMLFQSSVFANAYYLYYEQGCMTRMEYAFSDNQAGQEYILYSMSLGGGSEKLVLETGIESLGGIWRTPPASLIACNSPERALMRAGMADAINQKVHQVYVVYPVGSGQYRVSLVKRAYTFNNDGSRIQVDSDQYRFSYIKEGGLQTGDLSGNHIKGRVFYSQTTTYGGCSALVFRRAGLTANKYLDITVVPELGVVEERNSDGTFFKLKKVNSFDAEPFLSNLCGNTFASRGDIPVAYDNISTTQITSTRRTHTVQPRESLYGIAKRYQINLADLMSWNNLRETSVIQSGMSLFIEGPATPFMISNADATDQSLWKKGSDKSSEQPNAWLDAPELYTVQQGETVASIAKKFGYTEERFRYFNNIPDYRVLAPGEKVKTSDCTSAGYNGQTTPGKVSPYFQDPLAVDPSKTGIGTENTVTPRGATVPGVYGPEENFFYGPVPGKSSSTQVTETPIPYDYRPSASPPASSAQPVWTPSPQTYGMPSMPGTTPRTPAVKRKHLVREGETLYSIARKYGMTEAQLRALNDLGPGETIVEFQTIFVN